MIYGSLAAGDQNLLLPSVASSAIEHPFQGRLLIPRFRVYLVSRVVCVLRLPTPLLQTRLLFSRCAPAATNPKVYAERYAARAAVCRGCHIGSLQELPHTICDPVVPLLGSFYDPR
jgi:hypothetical protein